MRKNHTKRGDNSYWTQDSGSSNGGSRAIKLVFGDNGLHTEWASVKQKVVFLFDTFLPLPDTMVKPTGLQKGLLGTSTKEPLFMPAAD